ncbi:MAG: hypothetical protein HQ509_00310 [Candidatus Marinimicrobia bacterium]|nr:hypothetical protein [Candidatus Neomarinimicrobiota bacterium]
MVKVLPEGWALNGVLAAAWGSGLPEFTKSIPDTSFDISFWEETYSIDDNAQVIIPRATITYAYKSGVSREEVQLEYINIQNLVNPTSLLDSDYILSEVKRSVYLFDTNPVQLTSDDIIKRKMLMVYGSPIEFDGLSYIYYNDVTDMNIREIDDRHLIIHLKSINIKKQLAATIEMYHSKAAKEKQKLLLLEQIEL